MNSVIIAGDLVPIGRVSKLFDDNRFAEVLDDVRSVTKDCDFSIVNLEAPVVLSKDCKPIKKAGPNLKTNYAAIEAIKYAGFDAVTLANNHFRDYGNKGCEDTLGALLHNQIKYVGGGVNDIEAQSTLFQQLGKWGGCAVINCCENEYSIADRFNAGANAIDPVKQYYSIQEAKIKADYVIVIVHGGVEGYQLPTPRMQEWYRYFIDCGADVVVNHHQHCYSGYEIYRGKPIFYGLGNFCFGQNLIGLPSWHKGFMLKLSFDNTVVNYELIPYIQCRENPRVDILTDKRAFFDNIEKLNNIIKDSVALNAEYKFFLNQTEKSQKYALCPYKNKYLAALYVRGYLPEFLPLKRWRDLQNKIMCESHRDRFLYFLKNKLK